MQTLLPYRIPPPFQEVKSTHKLHVLALYYCFFYYLCLCVCCKLVMCISFNLLDHKNTVYYSIALNQITNGERIHQF